jgi:flagellar hook assembly protein FlgD
VTRVGNADVAIFDVTGRAVRTLWEGAAPSAPSTIQWDGRESSGSRVSAGNYLVRVRVAGEIVGTHLITHIR